jgi:superfamily II DNA/RNA helicase
MLDLGYPDVGGSSRSCRRQTLLFSATMPAPIRSWRTACS